ncbi:hypothetical protein [Pontibacter chitinilyticus]|uniref:hypothetical protein n=1 Tax=Pontibacter chitinilyticus TaxID=2674989 RepID=UPI0032197BD1
MKKTWKLAFAAFAVVAFTACGNDNNAATESDVIESTDQVESNMDTTLDTDTTITVQDTTVNDGVVDDMQEEQPPAQ